MWTRMPTTVSVPPREALSINFEVQHGLDLDIGERMGEDIRSGGLE